MHENRIVEYDDIRGKYGFRIMTCAMMRMGLTFRGNRGP